MAHTYGFLKGRVADIPGLRHKRTKHEIQYHLHAAIQVDLSNGTTQNWDTAINVGTNDSDDLLKYKLVFDFRHPVWARIKAYQNPMGRCPTARQAIPNDLVRQRRQIATEIRKASMLKAYVRGPGKAFGEALFKQKVAIGRTRPSLLTNLRVTISTRKRDGKVPDDLRAGEQHLSPACGDHACSSVSAQFEPTDRVGGTIGYWDAFDPVGLGTDEFAGAVPSVGAPGNCTGSRMVRSFDRRLLVHPVTNKSEAAAAARRNVVFIGHLLHE